MPVRRGENPVSIPQYETLCPSPGQVLELWTLYKQRVDPLTKLIHAPSFEEKLLASYKDIRSLPTTMQTLLLSIYFAAVKSLTPLESVSNFGRSQDSLLRQYGQGLDGALKAADRASDGPSLEVIQAAGIYLVRSISTYNAGQLSLTREAYADSITLAPTSNHSSR